MMQIEITCVPAQRKSTKMYIDRFPANFIMFSGKFLQFHQNNCDLYYVRQYFTEADKDVRSFIYYLASEQQRHIKEIPLEIIKAAPATGFRDSRTYCLSIIDRNFPSSAYTVTQ